MISGTTPENFSLMLEIARQLLNKCPELLREENGVLLLETVKDILMEHFRDKEIFACSCEIATTIMIFLNDHLSTSVEITRIQRSWMVISSIILR